MVRLIQDTRSQALAFGTQHNDQIPRENAVFHVVEGALRVGRRCQDPIISGLQLREGPAQIRDPCNREPFDCTRGGTRDTRGEGGSAPLGQDQPQHTGRLSDTGHGAHILGILDPVERQDSLAWRRSSHQVEQLGH